MAVRILKPLKVVTFNANDIARWRYELSKQLQDVALLAKKAKLPLKLEKTFPKTTNTRLLLFQKKPWGVHTD
jgi:hypothetical protein